ncbi:methyltransferase domain-containing protein [Myroides marinus]|uniref:methyltransferase domain-containing protein n=1 Tax=Myroides TaxID=76831 RepID=UPI002576F45B|nr:methyltransferase domain-containing protein [Myroides marinus]MDM1534181.1 methyltransferase domain-containing protein [Myroides marinus]MDM1541145.1 methyltransferase domain-containing protein [Myroides marinus]
MNQKFNKAFWEEKYITSTDKWHTGSVTTPIKEYIDQISDKTQNVLIPGLGHGHELYYLFQSGFSNINGLDFTDIAVKETANSVEDFPLDKVTLGDFFAHTGQYDLIIEQTFFCSLPISSRTAYVDKMYELLKPGGKLVGVLFDCNFATDTPPFGGSKEEYINLFKDKFEINVLETAHNSIKPRAGRELFFIINKQHD